MSTNCKYSLRGKGSIMILWGSVMVFCELAVGVIIPWAGWRQGLEWSHQSWLEDCRILTQHCIRTSWSHSTAISTKSHFFIPFFLLAFCLSHGGSSPLPGSGWSLWEPWWSLGASAPTRKKISLKIPTGLFFAKISHRSFFAAKKFPWVLTMTTVSFPWLLPSLIVCLFSFKNVWKSPWILTPFIFFHQPVSFMKQVVARMVFPSLCSSLFWVRSYPAELHQKFCRILSGHSSPAFSEKTNQLSAQNSCFAFLFQQNLSHFCFDFCFCWTPN